MQHKLVLAISILLVLLLAAACEADNEEATQAAQSAQTAATKINKPTATATSKPTKILTVEPTAEPTDEPAPTESIPEALLAVAGSELVADRARVIDVPDGDTINVELNGDFYAVRLIGVDTPETVHPNKPVQCYGPEASAFTTQQLSGFDYIYLEKDITNTDKYDRLLRYVWLPDGRQLSKEILYYGYGVVSTYPPDVKYVDDYTAIQEDARNNLRGLWGNCPEHAPPTATPQPTDPPAPTATQPPAPTDTPVPQPPVAPPSNCDPSYPTVCIPPYPPDLNCDDVPFNNFTVTGSDPHGFDRDNDGIGCES